QAAGAEQGEAALVVGVVVVLVGVDERHVDAAGEALGQQAVERLEGRGHGQLDLVVETSLLPVTPTNAGPFLADVAAPQLAVGRQRLGDVQRGVAGESADLDRLPGADRLGEQCHLLALVRRDLHAGLRQLRGLLAQPALERAVAQPAFVDVIGEIAVDRGPTLHTQLPLMSSRGRVAGGISGQQGDCPWKPHRPTLPLSSTATSISGTSPTPTGAARPSENCRRRMPNISPVRSRPSAMTA